MKQANASQKKKRNRGSEILTTPIMIVLITVLLATFLVFAIQILTPYLWYEKLSSTCLKYIFVMEEYGYLTKQEKENLIEELTKQGFEAGQLSVRCTSQRQVYGSPIYLEVDYQYPMELPVLGERIVPMNIHRESVSKR